jgi:hypothetical protein
MNTAARSNEVVTPTVVQPDYPSDDRLEIQALFLMELHEAPAGQTLRQISAEVAEALEIPLSSLDIYDFLAGDPHRQSILVTQLLEEQDAAGLEELVGALRLEPFLEDPKLTAQTAALIAAPRSGELVTSVLKSHKSEPAKFEQQLIALSEFPEILAHLPSQGYEAIRSYLGFDKVAGKSLQNFDVVVGKTERKLSSLLGDDATARIVVERALAFPEHRFDVESKTCGRYRTQPFMPERLKQDVDAVLATLQQWHHYGRGALADMAVRQMTTTLQRTQSFGRLPTNYQGTVIGFLPTGGAVKASESLTHLFAADLIGHQAEVLASQLLIGMADRVQGVKRSDKNSTADRNGIDFMVKLPNGLDVCVDVKASDMAAGISLDKRVEHANTSKPHTHPDFTTRPAAGGRYEVYRAPVFVVVDPRTDVESAQANLQRALPGFKESQQNKTD